jgi:hypothetical protein
LKISNIVSPGFTTPLISWGAADACPGRGAEESFREEHDERQQTTASSAAEPANPEILRFIPLPTKLIISVSLHK